MLLRCHQTCLDIIIIRVTSDVDDQSLAIVLDSVKMKESAIAVVENIQRRAATNVLNV